MNGGDGEPTGQACRLSGQEISTRGDQSSEWSWAGLTAEERRVPVSPALPHCLGVAWQTRNRVTTPAGWLGTVHRTPPVLLRPKHCTLCMHRIAVLVVLDVLFYRFAFLCSALHSVSMLHVRQGLSAKLQTIDRMIKDEPGLDRGTAAGGGFRSDVPWECLYRHDVILPSWQTSPSLAQSALKVPPLHSPRLTAGPTQHPSKQRANDLQSAIRVPCAITESRNGVTGLICTGTFVRRTRMRADLAWIKLHFR